MNKLCIDPKSRHRDSALRTIIVHMSTLQKHHRTYGCASIVAKTLLYTSIAQIARILYRDLGYNLQIKSVEGVLMERMSIKTYAARNKLSMFNVVKMIKAGKLKSETVEEAGKEVTYILVEEEDRSSAKERRVQAEEAQESIETKVARLEQEVAILKRELDALKMSMGLQA